MNLHRLCGFVPERLADHRLGRAAPEHLHHHRVPQLVDRRADNARFFAVLGHVILDAARPDARAELGEEKGRGACVFPICDVVGQRLAGPCIEAQCYASYHEIQTSLRNCSQSSADLCFGNGTLPD